jgi:CRP-like cAMP-binding protein
MIRPSQDMTKNVLLRTATADDHALLRPHMEVVKLSKGDVLIEAGRTIAHIYFLEDGVGSTVAISPEGSRIEAGLFGREGMSGLPLVFSADRTPNETFIQIEGAALRLSADAFCEALGKSPTLTGLMLRYAQAMSVQAAHTTLSNALHDLPERLARWLLMCHDRVDGDDVLLTHEFMSIMLGVRRPGVTTALHVLEGGTLIRASRGRVTVRDRRRLEEYAADAYGVPEAEYERLIAPMRKRDAADM